MLSLLDRPAKGQAKTRTQDQVVLLYPPAAD